MWCPTCGCWMTRNRAGGMWRWFDRGHRTAQVPKDRCFHGPPPAHERPCTCKCESCRCHRSGPEALAYYEELVNA